MGNCWPKFKKRGQNVKRKCAAQKSVRRETNISEIISLSASSAFDDSLYSDEEIKMADDLSKSEVEYTSVRTFTMEDEVTALDELRSDGFTGLAMTKEPVFLEVDYAKGTGCMPRRLASRMDTKKLDQLKLTYEDELFMDEIVEEVEAKELLEYLLEKQRAVEIRRETYLQAIREKARDLSYGPQSRVVKFGADEGRKRGGRG